MEKRLNSVPSQGIIHRFESGWDDQKIKKNIYKFEKKLYNIYEHEKRYAKLICQHEAGKKTEKV